MATLWLKFPDEVLLCHVFTAETQARLEQIFSPSQTQSPWLHSLSLLGFKTSHDTAAPMIKWHNNAPYFNWSHYIKMISGGSVAMIKAPDGGYTQSFNYNVKHIIAFVGTQWKIARFLGKTPNIENPLVESITLGIALQGLIIGLGTNDDNLEKWLAAPESVPPKHRKAIKQMQAVQMRRTEITDVWRTQFIPAQHSEKIDEDLPDYFWDDQIPAPNKKPRPENTTLDSNTWKGKSVCSGNVTGMAILIDSQSTLDHLKAIKKGNNAPLILVFKSARPDTTELFEGTDALVFCNGGVLSHACAVAREMHIPCVTALGSAFFSDVQSHEKTVWLHVDAHNARVTKIENAQ